MTSPRIGSLCSGYGGLDLGLITFLGGGEVSWHVENDKHPSKVLDARFPGVPNYGDLTKIDWAQVEPVDWLTAGYPCQPFSHAGKRKGKNDERHLWPLVANAVGALRPRRVLLENVAGHVSLGLDAVLWDLTALGYDTTWGVVRASDAGAPHTRERIFIVATNTRRERHGRGQDGRSLGRVDRSNEGEAREWERPRAVPGDRDAAAAVADPGSARLRERPSHAPTQEARTEAGDQSADRAGARTPVNWGPYAGAIHHWERVLGRRVPDPVIPGDRRARRNPRFVEWMMGLPDGWVTDILPRNPAAKALGNGVVPQQAALALSVLLPTVEVAA